ncbi:MAG: VCBS repeat-containing protein [Bacteroidia bacterium]|nr:VCBS repeat-containing protein [Bacteroidia bacterium]
MKIIQKLIVFLAFVILIISCNNQNSKDGQEGFIKIPSEKSGLLFNNLLDEENLKSPFNYINLYLGGGVAIGDINNDGLQDVYMTGNRTSSKLFLNKGNLQFEDITSSSGTGTVGWSSAVSMADVNNDGWLDIYVCRTYIGEQEDRRNLMFINNKDGSFTEKAEILGIADTNYSVAASFFDYDVDGDLDLIVGNHPRYRVVSLNTHYDYWKNPVKEFSNRLYRNDGERFTEVTEDAGILSYGFTLAVSTSDFTYDGYPDIFITVDHDEPDFIFKNNGDGTFSNILETVINQSSLSSMGIDAGDLNHDRFPDLFVAEMLSEDHYREKVSMSMQSVDRFSYLVDTMGYKYYQMHNFMYMNNGDETFSDVSQLAGVSKSDWTWASLFMDFDNDGWQDLYCTNGLYRDVFNKDKRKKLDETMMSLQGDMEKMNKAAEEYSRNSTQTKIKNYLFKNTGELEFEKYSDQAGLSHETISTGAAYGDLDNDGDLDLIISNIGEESFLYENISKPDNNFLSIELKGSSKINPIGTKVHAYTGDEIQSRELLTTRGFQSSCQPRIHFGLGESEKVDKVEVIWPDNKLQVLKNVKANKILSLDYNDATQIYNYNTSSEKNKLLSVKAGIDYNLDYIQSENDFNDYEVQVLLPHKLSEYGPFISVADVNADELDDIFIGSPHGQPSVLYLQNSDGEFNKSNQELFEKHKDFEDGQSHFFDADGDGDVDLFVTSTGYEFQRDSELYQSRLYMNNGKGSFQFSKESLPEFRHSSSCVKSADFDNDGDLDLFVGGRLNPHSYPLPGTSALFINDGNGLFSDKISEIAPGLRDLGMIKDALWTDINNDGLKDLIVVGEWTPVSMWINQNGSLVENSKQFLNKEDFGWWNRIVEADLDNNGLNDYILGNLGFNYKYKATEDKPFMVYAKDFDMSGSDDIVLGTYYGDVIYPVRGKSCSSEQIPDLKKEFDSYEKFALADITQVYGEGLDDALKYEVNQFASVILYQDEPGVFNMKELPRMAQISPVNDIIVKDLNDDGFQDLILGGNLYQSEIETGRADSGNGLVLINKKDKHFKSLQVYESGLNIRGDVKSLSPIKIAGKEMVLVGNNKDAIQLIEI